MNALTGEFDQLKFWWIWGKSDDGMIWENRENFGGGVRFFFENSLGLVNATEMHAYRENYCEDGKARLDCFYGKPKHNGDDVFASHNTSKWCWVTKKSVLKLGSTYIYDFPKLFTHILSELWQENTGKELEDSCISSRKLNWIVIKMVRVHFKISFTDVFIGIYINKDSCTAEGAGDRIEWWFVRRNIRFLSIQMDANSFWLVTILIMKREHLGGWGQTLFPCFRIRTN